MIRHGFPLAGIHFDWDYSVDYTPEQQVAYETMVLNEYEVDPIYFEEKYNMPVGERRQQPSPLAPSAPLAPDKKKKQQNNAHPFFD